MSDPGAILISGCSSGIGRAAAERLASRGHTVYATARSLGDRGFDAFPRTQVKPPRAN